MIYLYAFLFCGIICLIGQIILDNTKLTPGHLNALLVVVAAFLEMFGIYSIFIDNFEAGASVPITNFGYLLFNGAYNGYLTSGLVGLFTGILIPASAGLAYTIFIAFVIGIFFKPKH